MCLFQPQYIESCDKVITSQYRICEEERDPVVKDGVAITAEQVCVKQNCSTEWRTFCKTKPASILKKAISIQKKYKPGEKLLNLDFPPRIEIVITNVPESQSADPLELSVEGLNVASSFQLSPGEFLNIQVDTSKIKSAMKELGEEIKQHTLECSDSNVISIATQMLELMECIEKLLRCQDPLSVSNSVTHMLQEMEGKSKILEADANETLKLLKVTYDINIHVETVSLFSLQLKMIYAANIRNLTAGDTQWCAATSLFITNAANLMSSIKDVLKASKSAQALPHNRLLPDTTQATPKPHPHMSRQCIFGEYFGCEAPKMEDLYTAVINRTTGKSFNLADRVSGSWKMIGLRLGIEPDVLHSIEHNRVDDSDRLWNVLSRWLENAAGLPHCADYPLSWQGLNTLLEDIGKPEVAKQYFEFLDSLSSS